MVSIIRRMRVLRGRLATLRHGLGAAIFPPNVQRLTMNFSYRNAGGHMGARKFFQNHLPRIKFYNPELDVEVIRYRRNRTDEFKPPILALHFADKSEPTTLNLKDKLGHEICRQVLELTKAKELPINPEDARMANEYAELVKQKDNSEIAREQRRKAKREEKERERLGGVV